jgi:hypothetical protein
MVYYKLFSLKNTLTRSWTRKDRIKRRTTQPIEMGSKIRTIGSDSKGKTDPTVIGDLEPCILEA